MPFFSISLLAFILPSQYYRFLSIDEVLCVSGQAKLVPENATGFNPWKFTAEKIYEGLVELRWKY